ncbi:hypothetical protein CONCODRAFT_42124 [Conidiobolus coronatus NRRL 28638]|uniref:Extracellular metalloproteinase n=1 Tax=Conidiobolus coronatus (strain ATCC 28846 / CBS 209.66 / NRRL 28638) TaxID=796925 RepID=A0A137NZF1_CONC2|nr:hypothetical protein CONCODRAFT_42124 [Conidiobolus coronatus NRRL 28638]|eukprot:KXN68078.1 hypothetical protein CONCODRAFT_42124 [Conidiobolus coronatus NRRL 28638]
MENKDYVIKNSFTSENGVTHTYFKQLYKGKEIMNADISVNVDKNGNVLSYSDAFSKKASESGDSFSGEDDFFNNLEESLFAAMEALDFEVEGLDKDGGNNFDGENGGVKGIESAEEYLLGPDGEVNAVTSVYVDSGENMLIAYVNSDKQVVAANNLVHEAKYGVYPIGVNDPSDGEKAVVEEQGSTKASPYGWHDEGNGNKFTSTKGNNVIAYANLKGEKDVKNPEPVDGGDELNFDFPVDLKKDPSEYVNAAVANLFYVSNMIHDVFYVHGFDEASGNFQNNNFDKGGLGNDAVNVQAQDGSGFNNANFATPKDGKRPKMRMYVWDKTDIKRDGDLDNGIIIHEYTHGLSNRLTGGANNDNCMTGPESKGMGEGWGDAMAIAFRLRKEHNRDTEFGMGNYVGNTAPNKGIRNFPYSTNMQHNPQTYSSTNQYKSKNFNNNHAIGAVWNSMLYEVLFNLIDKKGFSPDLLSGKAEHGNTLFIRLLIDGMKLHPCNPSFIQARDAIILADQVLNNSDNKCEIWKGFAKRGLGKDAKLEDNEAKDGFELPEECK